MVNYTVEVLGQKGDEPVYIMLIGTVCQSKPQRLPLFWENTITISCKESLGTLLIAELEARPCIVINNEWYCERLLVTTPEGEKIYFPCYQWLDSRKPVVYLRDDKATLKSQDSHIELLTQRQEELNERRQNFKWKEYYPGLPWVIDAASASDLPNEVKFSFTKGMRMDYSYEKALAQLKIETSFHWSHSWQDEEELSSLFNYPEDNVYVQDHWKSDEFFGYQLLNGMNPMMIEQCSELPENFQVKNEMVNSFFPGSDLQSEMQKGNIFLCDYKRLSSIVGNVIKKKQQYLAAPLCLLFSTRDRKLIPIAIQLYQEPSKVHPIFLPSDSEWDWLLAKIFVRHAEFIEHELNFHLLRTHMLAEVFSVATLRNLPSAHPLFKLLMPHTRYTLHINIMARNTLISKNGIFAQFTSIGHDDEIQRFLTEAMSSLTYSSLCLPDNIKERGLEDIPNYYYKVDGLGLWNIIFKFVGGLLRCYYREDEDVKEDSELQDWIKDIFQFGFQGNDRTGIPQSFRKVDDLIKFVTMVIFTVSAQHAALNNGQFNFGGWMPNFPSSLRLPPPTKKGEATKKTIFDTLPDVNTTVHILAVLNLLSKKSSDRRQLGQYTEELFGDDEARRHIKDFQKDLQKFEENIKSRNEGLKPPYLYLLPTHVDNSVDL
ncbi:polyunsaturated fatty acid lipoxygenase ALOX15B-like [Colossoma macropomum]|uniref:polyunsaturated fatty acid lipoxygenase ALOX15B-like n=1 Tax=Colossoma macropomum TaxID=42526 RepID=UPI001863ED72|nr:polyunsaturated fatty acid lipoxygenase ALOX15B-like [Colossoma macropomum]